MRVHHQENPKKICGGTRVLVPGHQNFGAPYVPDWWPYVFVFLFSQCFSAAPRRVCMFSKSSSPHLSDCLKYPILFTLLLWTCYTLILWSGLSFFYVTKNSIFSKHTYLYLNWQMKNAMRKKAKRPTFQFSIFANIDPTVPNIESWSSGSASISNIKKAFPGSLSMEKNKRQNSILNTQSKLWEN